MKKHQKFSKITKWMFWFIALNFIGLSFAQSPNTGVYLSWDKESSCQNWSDDDEGVKFNDLDFDDNDCLKVCINSQVVLKYTISILL
jgi:hypothetical protein